MNLAIKPFMLKGILLNVIRLNVVAPPEAHKSLLNHDHEEKSAPASLKAETLI